MKVYIKFSILFIVCTFKCLHARIIPNLIKYHTYILISFYDERLLEKSQVCIIWVYLIVNTNCVRRLSQNFYFIIFIMNSYALYTQYTSQFSIMYIMRKHLFRDKIVTTYVFYQKWKLEFSSVIFAYISTC